MDMFTSKWRFSCFDSVSTSRTDRTKTVLGFYRSFCDTNVCGTHPPCAVELVRHGNRLSTFTRLKVPESEKNVSSCLHLRKRSSLPTRWIILLKKTLASTRGPAGSIASHLTPTTRTSTYTIIPHKLRFSRTSTLELPSILADRAFRPLPFLVKYD